LTLEATFATHRPLLFRLCYRMTGSAADAEDLVQETFARAIEHPPADEARDLKPWLVHVALNLSRDQLRRRKRQGYVGPWLPSPLETEGADTANLEPEARYGELESVSQAFLIALEALNALQRAVVILRDVLGHSVSEAAALLRISEANLKTTHHRARAKLAEYDAQRLPLTAELQARTQDALMKLMTGLLMGDVAALETLLANDVITLNDSDGEYYAAQVPVLGAKRVIQFHLKIKPSHTPRIALRQVNGLPALVAESDTTMPNVARRMVMMVSLDRDGRIRYLNTTVATRKLSHTRFGLAPKP
jgi:RNA polymerase sigma-70 factor (ECF subfamily)